MRHAKSTLNEKMGEFKARTGVENRSGINTIADKDKRDKALTDYMQIICDPENKDARLSENGVSNVLNQADLVKHLAITHVYVSPMKRAV